MRTLKQLIPGERGTVRYLHGQGAVHQRLLEMGVSDGAEIEVIRYAPFGDPMEVHVRGYNLTMRMSEAALVELDG